MTHSETRLSKAAADYQRQQLGRKNLEQARRLAAASETGYDSRATRREMADQFSARSDGKRAYEWQLDVAEAFLLGLDCVVIAGTGAGKTIPYLLPLLLPENARKTLPVISPLKSLQRDQATRFRKLGVSAVAANGDTWTAPLRQALSRSEHRALFLGPEMCLKHVDARETLRAMGVADRLLGFVVDEAHCISEWGGEFRPEYSQLSALRTLVPQRRAPIAAFSATMAPGVLTEVEESLQINPSTAFYLNLGNNRPNIYQQVFTIENSKDFAALDALLPLRSISRAADIPKTLIFANSRRMTLQIWSHLCQQLRLPTIGRLPVAFLHAYRRRRGRRRVMESFVGGDVRILVATEAAGMGADIPDIEHVIQFGAPPSLTTWIQRAGRAGRSPNIYARATLLIEKSAFQIVHRKAPKKPKKGHGNAASETQPGTEYRKKIDKSLRVWLGYGGCRREAMDEYFNNPIRSGQASHSHGRCCDICFREASMPPSPALPTVSLPAPPLPAALSLSASDTPAVVPPVAAPSPTVPSSSSQNKRPRSSSTAAANILTTSKRRRDNTMPYNPVEDAAVNVPKRVRAGAHREAAIKALKEWRLEMVRSKYKLTSFSEECILSDDMISSLVHDATLSSVEAVTAKLADPPWVFAPRHSQDVLDILARVDATHAAARASKESRRRRVAPARPSTVEENDENNPPLEMHEDVFMAAPAEPSNEHPMESVVSRPRPRPRGRVYDEDLAAPSAPLTRAVGVIHDPPLRLFERR